jgi:hypothetical protein
MRGGGGIEAASYKENTNRFITDLVLTEDILVLLFNYPSIYGTTPRPDPDLYRIFFCLYCKRGRTG